jgi:hypothetical protein
MKNVDATLQLFPTLQLFLVQEDPRVPKGLGVVACHPSNTNLQPPPAPPYQGGELLVPLLVQEGLGVVVFTIPSITFKPPGGPFHKGGRQAVLFVSVIVPKQKAAK